MKTEELTALGLTEDQAAKRDKQLCCLRLDGRIRTVILMYML